MRILIAGVNYSPEVTGIGPYTTGLAEHLAGQGHDVVVATSFPFAPHWRWFEPPPRWRTRQQINGVEVWRTKVLLPPRRTTAWRIALDSSFALASAMTALSVPRVDVSIWVSPPIQPALLAVMLRFKVGKMVLLVQDLPSQAAGAVGMLNGGPAMRAAEALEHLAYKLADHLVVISGAFAKHLETIGIAGTKVTEIPNWANTEEIRPAKPDPSTRRRLGANPDDFLVVHTGNMGAKQDLLNAVAAAALLRANTHIKFALIGDGQERARIAERILAERLDNIRLIPLVSPSDYPAALAAANALLITQSPALENSVMPSKLLAYMASSRPIMAAVHPRSTVADLVLRSGCGVVVNPGRPSALADAISSMACGFESMSGDMGRRGRAYVVAHFARRSVLQRLEEVVTSLPHEGRGVHG